MADGAQTAALGAREAAEMAGNGATQVDRTIDAMGRIKRAVDGAADEITRLGGRSEEIGKIVAVIEDIAAQTNLLALNAAIEAARAGEQGRGFAVVADEVRQLAERVADATKEITQLIGGVQAGVDASVKAMGEGATEMESGNVAATEAGQALQQILDAANGVSEQISSIAGRSEELKTFGADVTSLLENIRGTVEEGSGATREMRTTADALSASIDDIASVASENDSATSQVAAAAEEMTAQVDEMSAATHVLGSLADELSSQVSTFKLPSDGSEQEAGVRGTGRVGSRSRVRTTGPRA